MTPVASVKRVLRQIRSHAQWACDVTRCTRHYVGGLVRSGPVDHTCAHQPTVIELTAIVSSANNRRPTAQEATCRRVILASSFTRVLDYLHGRGSWRQRKLIICYACERWTAHSVSYLLSNLLFNYSLYQGCRNGKVKTFKKAQKSKF